MAMRAFRAALSHTPAHERCSPRVRAVLHGTRDALENLPRAGRRRRRPVGPRGTLHGCRWPSQTANPRSMKLCASSCASYSRSATATPARARNGTTPCRSTRRLAKGELLFWCAILREIAERDGPSERRADAQGAVQSLLGDLEARQRQLRRL
ncbi:hypothetical protein PsYK624_137090 [Phanerochaete sordida]|uniref:Uncharacterized protein n=1 Tax=Phanerochaete sordida TaxID=48140 RepID=A0A9P3GKC4_9APHY|nr:hypothetical protein PsYK624_137090 [Phanerochaete sordida]